MFPNEASLKKLKVTELREKLAAESLETKGVKDELVKRLLEHFEAKENYLVCAGIHLGLNKVEDLMHNRFEEATAIEEDGDHKTYSYEEYENVSKQVLKDIIIEMYEKQAEKFKDRD